MTVPRRLASPNAGSSECDECTLMDRDINVTYATPSLIGIRRKEAETRSWNEWYDGSGD
jgi:hypothetical protein